MKLYRLLLITVLFAAAAVSCRKDAPEVANPNDNVPTVPSMIFQSVWDGLNNSYAFWDVDPTDWDAVYDKYMPEFKKLDQETTVSSEQLQYLYTEMTKTLIDHHMFLVIKNFRAADGDANSIVVQPGEREAKTRDYYHELVGMEDLLGASDINEQAGRITDKELAVVQYGSNGNMQNFYACSYNIDDGIIYLRLSNFLLYEIFPIDAEGVVKKVFSNYFRLIRETPNIKGVIIDVRSNGGGYLDDMKYVFAPLIDEVTLIGYSRCKNGPNRLDYDEWVPCRVYPAAQLTKVEAPVVALVDLHSASMAEMTAMAVSALPNGVVIGERTFGATGPLFGDYGITYAGSFQNNAVHIQTSTALLKDVYGVIHEGVGVYPDVEVFYDADAFAAGRDAQLEAAIEYIKGV